LEVRPEAIRDRSAVRALHVAAFGEDHVPVVANLVDELRDAVRRGEGLSLVAAERDQIVGHVMFSPSLLDAPKRLLPVQVLSPIGVVPERQNQGVGTALIRRGIELLSERDVPLVFLEGAPGYYSRFGFVPGAAHGFRKPSLRIPGGSVPSAPTPDLRVLDDGHAGVRRGVLEARRRRAPRPESLKRREQLGVSAAWASVPE
jgi:putative acetyltransferase